MGRLRGRQAQANAHRPLPLRDGVAPSYLWLAADVPHLLEFLLRQYPDVTEATWRARIARGEVVDGAGTPLAVASSLARGARIWYYREIEAEPPIPFHEQILHRDDDLLVVDKPHFLPMTPGGRYLQETLLVRLKRQLGEERLTPIHRLDRETAGVVIFSLREETRGAYQTLFQQRAVHKVYEALAAPMARRFPFTYRSRMEEAAEFFRMREVAGEPNSETLVDTIRAQGDAVLYRLEPHTGRKHQLRVHMAALGAPIFNDGFYPDALPDKGDDFSRPLQLLARSIAFSDPLTGDPRYFESGRTLSP